MNHYDHGNITCVLNGGRGTKKSVFLFQYQGEMSEGKNFLSYQECEPGYEFIKVIFPDLIPYIFEIGSFMHNFLNVVFIFYKICLIKYYPYNFSIRSIIASSLLFLIYFIYLKCIVIN